MFQLADWMLQSRARPFVASHRRSGEQYSKNLMLGELRADMNSAPFPQVQDVLFGSIH